MRTHDFYGLNHKHIVMKLKPNPKFRKTGQTL